LKSDKRILGRSKKKRQNSVHQHLNRRNLRNKGRARQIGGHEGRAVLVCQTDINTPSSVGRKFPKGRKTENYGRRQRGRFGRGPRAGKGTWVVRLPCRGAAVAKRRGEGKSRVPLKGKETGGKVMIHKGGIIYKDVREEKGRRPGVHVEEKK